MFVFRDRVTRGPASDTASLNSHSMFNTSVLYQDPLLDTISFSGGGSGKASKAAGGKGAAKREAAYDTASLRSQDDTAR
jgi:hypothetical protein